MLEIDINEFKNKISKKIECAYLNKEFLIKEEEPLDMKFQQIISELFTTDIIGIYEDELETFEITVVRELNVIAIIINTEKEESLLEVLLSVDTKDNCFIVKNVITSFKHMN